MRPDPLPATPDQARARLADIAADQGESLAGLSRLIGRNAAYLQQYVTRGSPRRLADNDRNLLARYLGVDEREFGARDDWTTIAS